MEDVEKLREKIKVQAREISHLNEVLARKNRELDALHFVWCDGECPSGIHRYHQVKLTRELVEAAERNTRRMRNWYDTVKWRLGVFPTMSEWHDSYAKRAAIHTDLDHEEE